MAGPSAIAHHLDEGSRAVLARTNRELAPAAVAAIESRRPFRATDVRLIVESGLVDVLLDRTARETRTAEPLLVRLGRIRRTILDDAAGAEPGATFSDDPDAGEIPLIGNNGPLTGSDGDDQLAPGVAVAEVADRRSADTSDR